jgi:hypothetical protein
MNALRLALLALLVSPAFAFADAGLSEAVSAGRISFDRGRAVEIQQGAASAVAIPEVEEEVAHLVPTAVDGQGTEADPIPIPKRAKRPQGISANFDAAMVEAFGTPSVPIRPTGLLLLGILGTLATGLTAGGLLTEN